MTGNPANSVAFKDRDPKILQARNIAYSYMKKIMLCNVGYPPNEKCAPKNLQDTLERELDLQDDSEFAFLDVKEDPLANTPVREYDPERERLETAEHEEQEKQQNIKSRFKEIYAVMKALADETQPIISSDELYGSMCPLLKNAQAFIAGSMLSSAELTEAQTTDDLRHPGDIARTVNGYHYPGPKDKSAAEYTRADLSHTQTILRYMNERSKVIGLALGNFLGAVQEITNIVEGPRR
jgi:hypothetical protein